MRSITILLLLSAPVCGQSTPASPRTTAPALRFLSPPPASTPTPLPAECDICGKARPLKRTPKWESDHELAHHIADTLIRTEGRRITTDKGQWRDAVKLLKVTAQAHKMADPKSMAWELLDQAFETLEIVVLQLEHAEGELKRCHEAGRQQ